tara:strand:- start:2087 stop:2623 length:537 start_codon:yes stop_codon:yes gene_type:complete
MSLKEWFGKGPKGDWVDIGAPKKGGKFQACGRSSASKSKRAYPKCVPRSKAKSMTASERKSAVARKRAKPQGVGGKPTNVATIKRKNMEGKNKKKMYGGGMVQTGTPDRDKIMGAGTMQQNPQQSLMEMNRNRVTGMNKGGKVNPGMDALGKSNPDVANKILGRKVYAMGGGVRKVRY